MMMMIRLLGLLIAALAGVLGGVLTAGVLEERLLRYPTLRERLPETLVGLSVAVLVLSSLVTVVVGLIQTAPKLDATVVIWVLMYLANGLAGGGIGYVIERRLLLST